jgi:hypothetical protein
MRYGRCAPHPTPWLAAGILVIALILASCDRLGPFRAHDAGAPTCGGDGRAEIGGDVVMTLEATGEAHVMIALQLSGAGAGTVDERSAEIARAQERVLDAVDAPDYRNRVRFETVPALAGTLYTHRGLEILAKHPDVRRIDLDHGGGGH